MFDQTTYLLKNKLFSFVSMQYFLCDGQGNKLGRVKKKAFKLKEDIRLCDESNLDHELLQLKARQIIDFGVTYDVIDSQTQQRIGALRRKGLRSMLRDAWEILNYDDQVIGKIHEDSWGMAFIRRFVFGLIPQKYHAEVNGQVVARFRRNTYILRDKLQLTIEPDGTKVLDTKFWVAAAILLFAVEGGQS